MRRIALVLGLAAVACAPSGAFESPFDPESPDYVPAGCETCPVKNTLCVLDESGSTRCDCPAPFAWMPQGHPAPACCPPGDVAVKGEGDLPACCTPQCQGRTCGDDRCGGSCGTCGGDKTFCANDCVDGQCVFSSSKLCKDRECGFDPVCPGESCGACAAGNTCGTDGRCR